MTINYYIRDDISGLASSGITLRDPQGVKHFFWGPGGDADEYGYFLGDPTAWKRYEKTIILPQGSAPGIWGISEMNVRDFAFNDYTYNFVETLIFQPDDSEDGWVLFAEMEDEQLLNIGLTNSTTNGYGYTYRIISEASGEEISGTYSPNAKTRAVGDCRIDVSSLPNGKLIVIVTAKDGEDNVLSVKSTIVNKTSSTSIEDIVNDSDNSKAEYYNMQGINVNSSILAPGIYIMRQGNKSSKILVK